MVNPSKLAARFASKYLIILALATLPLTAAADPVSISGSGAWGSFIGTFDYSVFSEIDATLTITLTNTSPAANGGYITGFVFNNPANAITLVAFSAIQNPNFGILCADPVPGGCLVVDGGISASPYGNFDFGAALLGGSFPTSGIASGQTGTFTFFLVGAADDLSWEDFFSSFSSFSTGGSQSVAFLVRFDGFENEQSDNVPGIPVPEPATVIMMGTGLTALARIARRRMKNQ